MSETATPTSPEPAMQIWQRMPPGWIEFRAIDDPDAWWENYLASGEGWLSEEATSALTTAFRMGISAFAGTSFDFAGVHLTFDPAPAVWLMCTQVVRTTKDSAAAKSAVDTHRTLALAKLGPNGSATTFTAGDGRVGTITFTAVPSDDPALTSGGVLVAVGELPLPDRGGSAFLTGFCSDLSQFHDLLIRMAFTLDTLQLLPEGQQPPADQPEQEAQTVGSELRGILDQG
ncbi:hypothetical protein FB381_2869 [Nocardioides albertanoniae]|uniref:Uncharacterized protein n=1 Tax=Nocardioides albertanoniae TaxID=1175486 RepID=A0A543A8N8_9ACTN|nr:hypothetical protein [Nocardioides albertanoniae]TQL68968.1 hypothetical protein FB381_2869 [Nocardioides albertanoniae]